MKKNFNIQELPIDQIKPNPWNPNVQPEFVFERQKLSLHDEGQVLPVLVRVNEEGELEIVDGEHRWKAAGEMGEKTIVVNNLGPMSRQRAELLGQKINRINGTDDKVKLKDLYTDLLESMSKEEILSVLPVHDFEFDQIIAGISDDWANLPSSPGGGSGDSEQWETIEIKVPAELKEQFDEQMTRFKKILHPDDDPKEVSMVMPFEAMLQVLAQTPDNHIMGE